MAQRSTGRSVSFNILPCDSPGDGDLPSSNLSSTYENIKAGSTHRRRRKSKSGKVHRHQLSLPVGELGAHLDEFHVERSSLESSPIFPCREDCSTTISKSNHRPAARESKFSSNQWSSIPAFSRDELGNGSTVPERSNLDQCLSKESFCSPSSIIFYDQEKIEAAASLPDSQFLQLFSGVRKTSGSENNHSYSSPLITSTKEVQRNFSCEDDTESWHPNKVDITENGDEEFVDFGDSSNLLQSESRVSDLSVSSNKWDFGSLELPSPFNHHMQSPAETDRCTFTGFMSGAVGVEPSVAHIYTPEPGQFYTPEPGQTSVDLVEKEDVRSKLDFAVEDATASQKESKENGEYTFAIEEKEGAMNHEHQTPQNSAHFGVSHMGTPQLLNWEQLMAMNSEYSQPVNISPLGYFLGEVMRGNASQSIPFAENEQKRQYVYNTMFHVPWRCELLIDVGCFVCLDSFLSLLTIMPIRIIMFFRRIILSGRQFHRPHADELSDFGCLLVLISGITLLQQADISYIYHMIRSQATIKLYVVYNVLEIFDKLCQSFGSDVLQVLLNSAEGVASCPNDLLIFESMRFILDQGIATVSFIVHSLIILSQSITISAAIRSHNNSLLALLISNNFAEVKSNVFKRLGKDNLHKLAYLDSVERFHIIAHLFFVLAQNLLAADEPWLLGFASNACMVLLCEILVDAIKHAFLAKFNEIKPAAYSDFLQALCKQTLISQSHEVHRTLAFVPLAPACVVIRVLIPLYATYLPRAPFWWRSLWVVISGFFTYIFLVMMKVIVGLGLLQHAKWYVERCKRKEKHLHVD